MKKYLLIVVAALMMLTSCRKNPDEIFSFEGTIVDSYNCTLVMSVSDFDYGYVVQLDTPDSVGEKYIDATGAIYDNCVLLYRTKMVLPLDEHVSGELYFDDKYSRAYCSYHYPNLGLPEAVCYRLD